VLEEDLRRGLRGKAALSSLLDDLGKDADLWAVLASSPRVSHSYTPFPFPPRARPAVVAADGGPCPRQRRARRPASDLATAAPSWHAADCAEEAAQRRWPAPDRTERLRASPSWQRCGGSGRRCRRWRSRTAEASEPCDLATPGEREAERLAEAAGEASLRAGRGGETGPTTAGEVQLPSAAAGWPAYSRRTQTRADTRRWW
jgi:hypothetical protein